MKHTSYLFAALLLLAPAAQAQPTYCRDIGGNKTYCTGGTVIHHGSGTTIIQNHAPPMQPQPSATLPNPLLQNNALPVLNAPYSGAGTQGMLPAQPAPAISPEMAVPQAAPVIVVPSGRGRVCHQFGNTLVCN